MTISVLSHRKLHRKGDSQEGASVRESVSSDFLVNDESLLRLLVKTDGGHGDFMGCFVSKFAKRNVEIVAQLTLRAKPETETGQVLIYICPECGDIGCGAYSVLVERDQDTYVWRQFSYENGYEKARTIADLGPYYFTEKEYKAAIKAAASF